MLFTEIEISGAIALLLQETATEEPSRLIQWVRALPVVLRVMVILGSAFVAHGVVQVIRYFGEWVATPSQSPRVAREFLARRRPRFATITGLAVSAVTFVIYFLAFGFVVGELTPLTLGQYMASATVIGLAVGFGTQGLVQDVVTGLTLIFSNAIHVGDLVEVSGAIGRAEKIGLRFYDPHEFHGPDGDDSQSEHHRHRPLSRRIRPGIRRCPDHRSGQQKLIEGPLRQRLVAGMRELDPDYADWMVTVTYRQ